MRRRAFIAGLGSAAVWPLVAGAQQAGKLYRIAWVAPIAPVADLAENSSVKALRAFFLELRKLSYVEQQNLIIDRYSAEGRPERYGELAKNVIARKPDVIVTVANAIPRHLQSLSTTIPIIALMADPVSGGLTTSLAHPDGNLTGVSID